ncbi:MULTISPECIES: M48 family metalloprotease [Mycetohabitans]|jgi:Zn-dependent protease with chaperone function|nr:MULTISPECIES: M48 family metalloprotease [Mycetohabitans]MCF7697084.1 M48 family metalloprotease [Mycetohabitans sp. B2]MCG1048724.1 M48 family metalloprotease [Mycetohabitans sp. B6]
MIPSHWFRRAILIVFIMEVGGGILWVAARLTLSPAYQPLAQTIASLIFLFGFYASAPLAARFLAPKPSRDEALQSRLAAIVASLPETCPIVLYDHTDKEANTVGLLGKHSRIYVTTALLTSMSDEGMRGVIAHESAHIRERHILITFTYACVFAIMSHMLSSGTLFFLGFLLFLALRRYCEYRADNGASVVAGRDATLTMLREMATLYPSKSWHRWFSFSSAYPTLAMRIHAVETGQKTMF